MGSNYSTFPCSVDTRSADWLGSLTALFEKDVTSNLGEISAMQMF